MNKHLLTPEQRKVVLKNFSTEKVFSVQYIDLYGDVCKLKDKYGKTCKFSYIDARVKAKKVFEITKKQVKVCKGWDIIDVFKEV